MALFTDGPISDAVDLQRYENDILNVATTEGIDLGAKIVLAQQDLANQVILFLLRRWPLRQSPFGVRRGREVNDVVVTGPIRQWHVHKTLALVYRDAYNNQLNDRYQGKWKEYEQLAKASENTYFQIGVGLVADPVPQAVSPNACERHWARNRRSVLRRSNLGGRDRAGRRSQRFRSIEHFRWAATCGDRQRAAT